MTREHQRDFRDRCCCLFAGLAPRRAATADAVAAGLVEPIAALLNAFETAITGCEPCAVANVRPTRRNPYWVDARTPTARQINVEAVYAVFAFEMPAVARTICRDLAPVRVLTFAARRVVRDVEPRPAVVLPSSRQWHQRRHIAPQMEAPEVPP